MLQQFSQQNAISNCMITASAEYCWRCVKIELFGMCQNGFFSQVTFLGISLGRTQNVISWGVCIAGPKIQSTTNWSIELDDCEWCRMPIWERSTGGGRSTALYCGDKWMLRWNVFMFWLIFNLRCWFIQMLLQSGVCSNAPPSLSRPRYAPSPTVHCPSFIVHRQSADEKAVVMVDQWCPYR